MNPSDEALAIARTIADELIASGATGVAVVGSVARDSATLESDIDLYALGEGPEYRLERREGWLVSLSWRTLEQLERLFHDPAQALCGVLGWRDALILHDPDRQLHTLRAEAGDWSWDLIGDVALDAWVAEEITGYAEEVQKLVRLLREGDALLAAVQRSILALRLARPLAVHRRLLCPGENDLWRMVNQELGEPWTSTQSLALGPGGEPFEETARAALELYMLASQEIEPILDDRQRGVVEGACQLIGGSSLS